MVDRAYQCGAWCGGSRAARRTACHDRSCSAWRRGFFWRKKNSSIDRSSFSGPQCGFAMAGVIDWINGPHIRLGASISPTPVSAVMRLWPSFLAPPVKSYLLPRAHDGTVEKGTHADRFRCRRFAGDVGCSSAPPDEKSAVDFTIRTQVLNFCAGVPPLRGINGVGHVTGRTATFTVANASVDAGDEHVLTLSEGRFQIPDTGLKPAPAVVDGQGHGQRRGDRRALCRMTR